MGKGLCFLSSRLLAPYAVLDVKLISYIRFSVRSTGAVFLLWNYVFIMFWFRSFCPNTIYVLRYVHL